MLAFQLKIMIKNSKPPIWRRVLVPSGITFSQLGMILNEAMGWSGAEPFEFEFFHKKLRFREDIEKSVSRWIYDDFSYLDAAKTLIREYMEEKEWFTYVYGAWGEWKHRVTIEKLLEDYGENFPQVVKYKGECPTEYEYGEYDEIEDSVPYDMAHANEHEENDKAENNIPHDMAHANEREENDKAENNIPHDMAHANEREENDKAENNIPHDMAHANEHEENDKAENSVPYNMEQVNETLRQKYFYIMGKAERRCQYTLYHDHIKGKYGLRAAKIDRNKENVKISSKELFAKRFADYLEKQRETYRQEFLFEGILLKDIFHDFEKEHIQEMAKRMGLTGISQMRKSQLIHKVVEHMMQPERFRRYFLCLSDEGIEAFEKIAESDEEYYLEDVEDELLELYMSFYIGVQADGRVTVPDDVWVMYKKIKDEAFEQERKKVNYVVYCMRTVECLYGVCPVHVFQKMLSLESGQMYSVEEIQKIIESIPNEYNVIVMEGDLIYSEELYQVREELTKGPGDREYYIPTIKEIYDLGKAGYIKGLKEADKMASFFAKNTDYTREEGLRIANMLQMMFMDCADEEEVIDFMDKIALESEWQYRQFEKAFDELWRVCRSPLLMGFTPKETEIRKRREKQQKNETIIAFPGNSEKKKIYPNDPCPCGSGKKYKDCCKNKRT